MKLPSWRVAQLERKGPPPKRRRTCNAASALTKLQDGMVLHSGRVNDGRWWMLSDGTSLTGSTAKAVTSNPRVVDCGDSLFPGEVRGQTFRYTGKLEGEEP
jgi:hypothetical protein